MVRKRGRPSTITQTAYRPFVCRWIPRSTRTRLLPPLLGMLAPPFVDEVRGRMNREWGRARLLDRK
ncbi:MAG: hypothetical protein E6G09_15975 [Actinobacteria bacterium]|nr:MAG: hypothetical protein E6G09_15975 [Actinomycetota bacterium]